MTSYDKIHQVCIANLKYKVQARVTASDMLPSISELPPIGAEESILDEAPFPDHTLQSQEVNNDAENANHAADHESDAESIEEAPPKKKAKKDFEHDILAETVASKHVGGYPYATCTPEYSSINACSTK